MQLRSRVNDALRKLGWEAHRFEPAQSRHARRHAILTRGRIELLLDVGGNVGAWGQLVRRTGYTGRIVSFEPVAAAFQQLQRAAAGDPRWECHRLALGERDGEAEIAVSENLGSSSFLEIEQRHVDADPEARYVGRERVEVARLDSLLPELGGADEPIYLKLDVQGYEMKVLDGATDSLGRVQAIETEVNLVDLYAEQPALCELLGRLEPAGFELFALEPCFLDPRTGQMLEMDALLVRRDSLGPS